MIYGGAAIPPHRRLTSIVFRYITTSWRYIPFGSLVMSQTPMNSPFYSAGEQPTPRGREKRLWARLQGTSEQPEVAVERRTA